MIFSIKLIIYLISLQDYDPDLPPELAAATGLHDGAVENANSVKSDVGQSDVMKGSGRMRPPIVCICQNALFFFCKKIYLLLGLLASGQYSTIITCLW
jgi:hypothetical protein